MKKSLFLLVGLLSIWGCEQPFDYNPADIPPFTKLAAPAAGEGYQVHVPAFPVPAQYERELYVRMPIGNTEDIYVNKFQASCRPGTHHLIAYGYENENDPNHPPIGVMRDQNLPDGRGNFNLTMGSGSMYCGAQEPEFIQEFPAGTAVKIPAGATIDVNSHYFNVTDATIFGEVFLNFHTIPASEVTEVLVYSDVSNEEVLFLPKNAATNIEYQEIFEEPVVIRQMFSHMHKRGYLFKVYKIGGANDGELLYEAYDYQHPPYKYFDEPLEFAAGEGIKTLVGYNNESNRDIGFGVTSEDEMGILFYAERE